MFDHVIVAGPKDRGRMIAEQVVAPNDCSVSGYIKLAGVLALQKRGQVAEPLFANDRPTILYNPHFAPGLSSWDLFGEGLARDVVERTDCNLIIAPHVRLRDRLSEAEQRRIEALAVPGRVIVDLGSERSTDMTYTLAADIYVGDVSSQVYEFLHNPRPCLFLNATGGDRRADADFAFWNLGQVVDRPSDVLAALLEARSRHPGFAALQADAVAQAFGPIGDQAVRNAAATIARLSGAAAAGQVVRAA
jgi:CDP-glycerol glycerophosphotransferase (TagB/SpsB family)